jgi:2-oxoglutarate ferredoxin oxidoreductase subunit alpha
VLGASFAGARAMTGTSGGGFALMVEALSLAGITECPAVIVNAQRPGPATGLPTRTEQGDLEFIIHAGHGEFPRLVLAPGTHAECFELTWRAFNWADIFQIPVILLTDQYLADWYTNVENFEINKVERDFGKLTAPDSEYLRYRLVDDGISPRAIPGTGSGVVIVDSDEHTEDGHLTEDLSVRIAMNEKRLRKLTALRESMLMPEISGTAKKNLVITWGSTYGAALDAAEILTSQGRELSVMHMKQLWPLHGDKMREIFKGYENIIVVEGNATGQLARLLQAETARDFPKRVLRYDGLPFFCDTLAKHLAPLLI